VQARIVDLIRELRDRLGLSFLFVSHDLSVVRRLADDVAVMYRGKLVESGPATALFEQPAHPYTRCLLAAVPVPDPDHEAPAVTGGEPASALTPPGGCVFHMRCPNRFERCAAEMPEETIITTAEAEHRVRCHLWNS